MSGVNQQAGGKTVRTGLIDGGAFVCNHSSHKEEFKTSDAAQWDAHRNDGKHTVSGGTVCVVCGKNAVDRNKFTAEQKPLCDDCRAELIGQVKKQTGQQGGAK